MSGSTFSSLVNFTTEQFLKRAGKLVVLTEIENRCVSVDLTNPLQFLKHHKHHSRGNKGKAIRLAFDHAYTLLSALDVQVALKKNSNGDDTSDTSSCHGNNKSNFHGMRVFDNIPPAFSNSYFTIAIDEHRKYVHKHTACWHLIRWRLYASDSHRCFLSLEVSLYLISC